MVSIPTIQYVRGGALAKTGGEEPMHPSLGPRESSSGSQMTRTLVEDRSLQGNFMVTAPVSGLTWTLRRSWRGQGRGAGSHQEEESTWAVLAYKGREQGNRVSMLATMGLFRTGKERGLGRKDDKGQEVGSMNGEPAA